LAIVGPEDLKEIPGQEHTEKISELCHKPNGFFAHQLPESERDELEALRGSNVPNAYEVVRPILEEDRMDMLGKGHVRTVGVCEDFS
jgi:hypothetical protein